MAQHLEDFAKPVGFSGVPVGYLVPTLTQDLARTVGIAAAPARHPNGQFHGAPLNREVPQMPDIGAVPSRGLRSTVQTGGRLATALTTQPQSSFATLARTKEL